MKNHRLSAPLVVLTSVATITLMLACTPSEHAEQGSHSGAPVLLEAKSELVENEHDARLHVENVKKSIARQTTREEYAGRSAAPAPLSEDAAMPASTAYGSAFSLQQLRVTIVTTLVE